MKYKIPKGAAALRVSEMYCVTGEMQYWVHCASNVLPKQVPIDPDECLFPTFECLWLFSFTGFAVSCFFFCFFFASASDPTLKSSCSCRKCSIIAPARVEQALFEVLTFCRS